MGMPFIQLIGGRIDLKSEGRGNVSPVSWSMDVTPTAARSRYTGARSRPATAACNGPNSATRSHNYRPANYGATIKPATCQALIIRLIRPRSIC